MTMIDANDPSFWERCPNGAKTYDAWGREILHVKACNPETGEVISYGMGWIARTWNRLLWANEPSSHHHIWRMRGLWSLAKVPRHGLIAGEHVLLARHGFHPAPLRVVANRPSVDAARACSHMEQAADQLRGLAASATSATEAIGAFRDAMTE